MEDATGREQTNQSTSRQVGLLINLNNEFGFCLISVDELPPSKLMAYTSPCSIRNSAVSFKVGPLLVGLYRGPNQLNRSDACKGVKKVAWYQIWFLFRCTYQRSHPSATNTMRFPPASSPIAVRGARWTGGECLLFSFLLAMLTLS